MPKKPTKPVRKSAANESKSTAVRYSAVPKKAAAPAPARKTTVTGELIAERAYFISISGNGGSQDENWLRAERELLGGL